MSTLFVYLFRLIPLSNFDFHFFFYKHKIWLWTCKSRGLGTLHRRLGIVHRLSVKTLCPQNLQRWNSDFYIVNFYNIRLLWSIPDLFSMPNHLCKIPVAELVSLPITKYGRDFIKRRHKGIKITQKFLLYLGNDSHGEHSTKLSGSQKCCCNSQWQVVLLSADIVAYHPAKCYRNLLSGFRK